MPAGTARTGSRSTSPSAETPRTSPRQWALALGFLVVLIVAVVLAVGLAGKGGSSIHPTPAPASPVNTDVTSRAP